jgi:hypothetical protein
MEVDMSASLAVLERKAVEVVRVPEVVLTFACHVCIEDGEILTSLAEALLSDEQIVMVVTFLKVTYTFTGTLKNGVLSATFKSSKGREGYLLAAKHRTSFIGTCSYTKDSQLIERKIRLVTWGTDLTI